MIIHIAIQVGSNFHRIPINFFTEVIHVVSGAFSTVYSRALVFTCIVSLNAIPTEALSV